MRISKIIIGLGLIVVLAFTSACTQNEVEQLEGIIQNVDAVNGKVTIITKDGQTRTLDIDTGASVETEGGASNLEALEVGAFIQVEVNEDNQVVQSIKAQQTEIEGEIVQIVGDEVTVETADGERVTIRVSENTRIESEGDALGTSTALQIGAKIEIKFDPESQVAFVISEQEEEAETDDGSDKETETETGSGTVSEEVVVKLDVEPDVEDTLGVESGVDQDGKATPDGDIDIDGDGWITIVDVVGGMEAERERLAEEIQKRTAAGEVDSEWVREVEAERERLAKEIQRALSEDTYIVVIDGKWLIMDIDPIEVSPDHAIDPPEGGNGDDGGDDGHDDGDDDGHDDGGDDGHDD